MVKHFSKFVGKGKELNYIFSAHFADKIFNEFHEGIVEAIIYPSVQDSGITNNIALKPHVFEEKYMIEEIEEDLVCAKNGLSLLTKRLKSTKKIDPLQRIVW